MVQTEEMKRMRRQAGLKDDEKVCEKTKTSTKDDWAIGSIVR